MPKSNRGGKTANTATTPKVDDTQTPNAPGTEYTDFIGKTDDEKADIISNLIVQDVPSFLAENSFQKLIYNLKMNDKPTLVDDATLNTMGGTELFRTVNNSVDNVNRIKYNADEIANQVLRGSVTRVSDTGGSAYGRGIYFADNYHDSTSYGRTTGDKTKTAVIRAKLNSNARVILSGRANSDAIKEIRSGSKLGRALAQADPHSRGSIYALAKGYNVMSGGSGYYVILNRSAITMSKEIRASGKHW